MEPTTVPHHEPCVFILYVYYKELMKNSVHLLTFLSVIIMSNFNTT